MPILSIDGSKISECHFVNCLFRQESSKSSAWYFTRSRLQCFSVRYSKSYLKFVASWVNSLCDKYKYIQYTLVDCPEHVSLIGRILGGAQKVEMLLIVLDCLKGIEAQPPNASLSERSRLTKLSSLWTRLTCFLPKSERSGFIKAATSTLKKALAKAGFKNAPIVSMGCLCDIDPCICAGGRRQHRECRHAKLRRELVTWVSNRWTN